MIDSGNCSCGYPKYRAYDLQSVTHNVVPFNVQAQSAEDLARGAKEPGPVYRSITPDCAMFMRMRQARCRGVLAQLPQRVPLYPAVNAVRIFMPEGARGLQRV
ncbi:hypothetical protein [Paenibacillus konkukensis]|uniref:hypothetical protein n=1 Tax=Paenibacillus konkukensis TaxID=2020716 RepID=UPI00201E613A